jgi:phosphoglycolate phosphatase
MPVEALVFDLDGTLVDTAPDLLAATNHVLATLQRRPITLEEVRAFVGHGSRALITRGCEATGDPVDPQALDRLQAQFLAYYGANIAVHSRPFPGLSGFLDRCKAQGLALAVCTNKPEKLSLALLDALGMRGLFRAVVGPDTIGVAKPDPRPYEEAVRRSGHEVPRSLMVGDSETDIRTARNAGVPVIAVSFGYTPQHVSAFHPTHIINHYDEAWDVLQRYF